MELKIRIATTLCLLTLIASMFFMVRTTQSSPETYGPRLDEIYGRYIESPAAQRYALETGEVDYWPDIRQPDIIRDLEDEYYNVVMMRDAMMYYHIDFNVRDQIGNGTYVQCSDDALGNPTYAQLWRGPPAGSAAAREAVYYQYYGARYMGYVPIDDYLFRYAVAHCLPIDEIVATVYGGISAAKVESLVPGAQKYWFNPAATMPPYDPGDPLASTVYNPGTGEYEDACSILRYAGYVFEPTAPNPAPKHSPSDPDGNWLDPHLHAATNDPGTVWDDTLMMPMNHILFAGVTQAIAPDSYGRDDLCGRDIRAIGLPVEHEETDYGYLTDTMMDFFQFDMYALGWSVGRFPDHLYDFFHSSKNTCPEGYNIPGVMDPTLDALLDDIVGSRDVAVVRAAAFAAQEFLNTKCVSLVTVTRPLTDAGATAAAPPVTRTDTLLGVVPIVGYTPYTGDAGTMNLLHWASNVDPITNPYGIGGSMNLIVPSEATNYHPAFASTTDEFLIMQGVIEALLSVNPYTHDDIPWIATDWTVESWTPDAYTNGVNITFWLRDDVYFHDGSHFNATVAKFSWDYVSGRVPPMPPVGRAGAFWEDYYDADIWNNYCLSVYQNKSSMFILYDCSGWAPLFPPHIYEGEDQFFIPSDEENPLNPALSCLVGTGPWVVREVVWGLGNYVRLTAYRSGASPVTTHWWKTVEELDAELTTMFHWVGDVNSDTDIDVDDLALAGLSFGRILGMPGYNPNADVAPEYTYHTPDNRVDMRDMAEIGRNYGKQRDYP